MPITFVALKDRSNYSYNLDNNAAKEFSAKNTNIQLINNTQHKLPINRQKSNPIFLAVKISYRNAQ